MRNTPRNNDPVRWLSGDHAVFEELLWLHQEALLERRCAVAVEIWDAWFERLRAHARAEEAWLLPCLESADWETPWPARVYRAEHARLQQLAGAHRAAVAEHAAGNGPGRREALGLIAAARRVADMSAHHEQREEEGLFPLLEANLPAKALQALGESVAAELSAAPLPAVAALRGRLDSAVAASA
ncbi:hemerythrin domain-containing protein [Arhodomonas aquaeolei]|uniref:hemerythrin domain-containing protein n=1 Tax=Arhodomonas aquaeolei TaxID=2369 RepID=UPI0021684EAA|nr:hemerythrin domain-containing protein [Arhodomonas aquaeolei]MCS4503741.1 hemerythrin domain-containing protein [Arhodomonas aquaeolei]